MSWSYREAALVQEVAAIFGVDLTVPPAVGLGSRESSKMLRLHRQLQSPTIGTEHASLRTLESFAKLHGLTSDDEFWKIKALALLISQHPYFAGPTDLPAHRPRRSRQETDADINEWCIQADWLRAVVQQQTGELIDDKVLAGEMSRRHHKLNEPYESWSNKEFDHYDQSKGYFTNELRKKKLAYESILRRHNFEISSMRLNSPLLGGGVASSLRIDWAPSDTERNIDGCLQLYKEIRSHRLERARLTRKL